MVPRLTVLLPHASSTASGLVYVAPTVFGYVNEPRPKTQGVPVIALIMPSSVALLVPLVFWNSLDLQPTPAPCVLATPPADTAALYCVT